jgi:hypothetical protein
MKAWHLILLGIGAVLVNLGAFAACVWIAKRIWGQG